MIIGDSSYIKKKNRGILLSKIIEHGAISRADLSKITGLNKATISVQVADLLNKELIYETKLEKNVIGRKPIMLSINSDAGYVLGIDLDYKHIQFIVTDLSGHPVHNQSITLETDHYEDIVQLLTEYITKYKKVYEDSPYGLLSVFIAIHGAVNTNEDIYFIPTYQWHNKPLKADLRKNLNIHLSIQNNANLSAYAERVYHHHESDNLLCIMLSSGIGSGMMIDGKLYEGFNGVAGAMGHMIVSQDGQKCSCGNHGCWELYASESSLYSRIAKKFDKDHVTFEDVQQGIVEKNPMVKALVEEFIVHLSTGLNNVINIYNPRTIILTSDILKVYPNAIEKIKNNLHSSVSQYGDIVLSELGNKSSIMGACALAIQHFLEVPELLITMTDKPVPFERVSKTKDN